MVRNFAISLFGGINQTIVVNSPLPAEFGLPPATEPDLTRFSLQDAFEDGEPDLFRVLRWDYGLLETLYGRDEELRAIVRWAEGSAQTATVRLVTGEGGAGKTRLAAAAALALRQKGWTAGFLPRTDTVLFEVAERGLFLILDYPEEQMERTRALFAKLAELRSAPYPIRLLLLSRRSFDAWEAEAAILEGRFGRQAIAAPGALSIEDATKLISEAANRFADAARRPVPKLSGVAAWLTQTPVHALPLFAMAAAIHAVLEPQEAFGLGSSALMRDLAKREGRRVRHESMAIGLGEEGLERLLALGVLGDGLSEAAIAELVKAGAVDATKCDVVGVLARSPWWSDGRLIRLRPDRPAAAFLDQALFPSGFPQGREALPDWLFIVLSERAMDCGGRIGRIQYDLASLDRAEPGAHPLDRCLIAMLRRQPVRANVFAPVAYQAVPHWAAPFAAEVATTLAERSEDPVTRAGLLNNGATYLSELGRREEALERAEEAVRVLAPFFLSHPAAFAPWMATMVSVYWKACEAVQEQPDFDLLGPIVERLQALSNG